LNLIFNTFLADAYVTDGALAYYKMQIIIIQHIRKFVDLNETEVVVLNKYVKIHMLAFVQDGLTRSTY
jgi:hypothetical protein